MEANGWDVDATGDAPGFTKVVLMRFMHVSYKVRLLNALETAGIAHWIGGGAVLGFATGLCVWAIRRR
jgi:hypothetical protein